EPHPAPARSHARRRPRSDRRRARDEGAQRRAGGHAMRLAQPEPVPPTIGAALAGAVSGLRAAGVPQPEADAQGLFAFAMGTGRAGIVAAARDPLAPALAARLEPLLRRRAAREPVAYIMGEREFWSLRLAVDRRVLVPRPETELLVETALHRAPHARRV